MSGRPQSASDELSFALAGPAVTAVVAAVFGLLALMLPSSAPAALRAVVRYQAEVNLLILGFNLVPAFPLDGGRVARAVLWRRSGNIAQATDTAAGLGRAFGYILIGGGILLSLDGSPGGLWFAVIGMFLVAAASAERVQEQVAALLTGVRVGDLMSQPVITIPEELSLAEAEQYFARHRFTAFPITDRSGRALGLLSIDQLEKAPRSAWSTTTAGELADRDPELILGEQEDVAHLLERPRFARIGRATVTDELGRPIGLISLTDVQRAIRANRLRHPPAGASNAAHGT
jgi:CBS domain-containing protein